MIVSVLALEHTLLLSFINLLTIFDISRLQLGKLVFKAVYKYGPMSHNINFTMPTEIHNHNTRCAISGNLFTNSIWTVQYRHRSLEMEGKQLWMELPRHIKTRSSVKSFTKKSKHHLISLYISLWWYYVLSITSSCFSICI